MRKLDFWKTDWFFGVMVVIVVALFNRFSDVVPSLERKAYDPGYPYIVQPLRAAANEGPAMAIAGAGGVDIEL